MLQIILLAAGQSRRMGAQNKLLLPFGGKTVLEATLVQLCAANIGQVYVVTGHEREQTAAVLSAFPVEEVFNPAFETGMTSSIQAGVAVAAKSGGYMICLGDMPLISTSMYQQLAARFQAAVAQDERAILLPRFEGNKGNPVIFAAVYRDDILRHVAPEGCKGIVQTNAAHVVWVDMADDGVLRDIDSPEDYAAMLTR